MAVVCVKEIVQCWWWLYPFVLVVDVGGYVWVGGVVPCVGRGQPCGCGNRVYGVGCVYGGVCVSSSWCLCV